MARYEITSFRGGISDYTNKGIEGSFKFASNIDIRKTSDTLTSQQALTEENGTIEALIHFFVNATDGNTYGFSNTGKIYKRDTNKDWTLVYTDANGAIKGAAEFPSDNGTTYLVWATDTKLHSKELPGASDWSDVNTRTDFPRTDLTSSDWHTMKPSGGDLVFCNKNTLGALGYDSSYSPEVLDLIPGNIAKTLVERHGRTIVGTHKPAEADKGVNAMIEAEIPLSQVGDDGSIFFSDMVDSMPATQFPGGGKVNPGGVALDNEQVSFFEWQQAYSSNPDVNTWIDKKDVGGMSLWGVFGAESGKNGIYSYGRKRKNHPFVLNLEYNLEVDEIGAVIKSGNDILVSYKDGSEYGVKRVDSANKAVGTYESLELKARTKNPLNISRWDYIELFMSPLPSGSSVELYYKLDKTGSFTQATQESGDATFTSADEQKVVFLIGEKAQIFEIKIVITPIGNESPEIYRTLIYFDQNGK